MKTVRFWAAAGTLAAAVVVGLVWLTPVTHGQVFVAAADDDEPTVRRIEVLGGRGSSIGVTVRDVEDADVSKHKLSGLRGAIIEDVRDESPAAKAGFKSGDVVVAFDGETVRSARQFARLVDETPVGRTVTTTVVREGARTDLKVTPGAGAGMQLGWRAGPEGDGRGPRWRAREMPMPAMPAVPPFEDLPNLELELERAFGRGVLGVGVQDLTPELADYFGAKDGVLVTSVQPDSPAAKAGLKAGDVITAVSGKSVSDAGDLRRELREADAADVAIDVVRDKKPLSLKATIEKPDRQAQRRRWPA